MSTGPAPAVTPDSRYIVVRSRRWRRADPGLDDECRSALTAALMDARRAVGAALRSGDASALAAARAAVDAAKVALGERGPVWWRDGAPDDNRRMARNTGYADWYASLEETPMNDADALGLPLHAFDKQDRGADPDFYAPPRLVTHIDEGAVAALTNHYASVLRPGDRVLDLMSSWVSHLPDDLALDVVGHGMNAGELAANPRLGRWFVQDLNRDLTLPEPDAAFDAVLICVGVQYLQHPLAVLSEARRVLKPGGIVVASYSNRCFPTKAVAVWRSLDMAGQAALIRLYLDKAGFRDTATLVLADGGSGDPLIAVEARA